MGIDSHRVLTVAFKRFLCLVGQYEGFGPGIDASRDWI
jgi:hypothetical protein